MNLVKRITEISKKHNLSHLGSCLTSVGIIDGIYQQKTKDEPFVLSCGHAFLGLAVVLEKHEGKNAEKLYLKHGVHPNRDLNDGIYCSTGSLGLGLTVALGMALADRTKNVYCLISDGELFEGSIWEVANVMTRYKVENLKIHLNFNGFSAYSEVELEMIVKIRAIMPSIRIRTTDLRDFGLSGISAHYVKLAK